MRQELPDRDHPFAAAGEGGPIGRHGLIEIDQPALRQLHDRRGGNDHLGQGGEVEDRIDGHRRLAWRDGPKAEGLAIDDAPADADHDDGAGNMAGLDLIANDAGDGLQPLLDLSLRGAGGGDGAEDDEARQQQANPMAKGKPQAACPAATGGWIPRA